MANSRINFNKIKNKKDKIKNRLKNKKGEKDDKPKKKNKKKMGYNILTFITLGAIGVVLLVIVFTTYIIIKAPEFSETQLFDKDSSIIYDKDNNVLATLGMKSGENVEKRIKLSYEELPEVLIDALVATEDSRFFQHNGVDIARFLKASFGQAIGTSGAGGASTLTMQLSKNAFTDTVSEGIAGIIRKFTDIYMAVFKIEKNYTKQDIISMYLNSEFLGNEAYGVEQASQTYFGKSAKDVSISEAALLAGLFQAPSGYDPFVYPEDAEARRNIVLNLMERHGYITEEQAEIAKQIPVTRLVKQTAPSSRPYQGYIDTVVEEVINKYDVNPYKVPIEIYTYFDKDKQDAINSVYDGTYGYEFTDEKVQLAVAVLDNNNSGILAVGAHRENTGERSYNYATMIKKHPGSTIKPILDYGPAIEYLNWSTYTPLFDEETTYTGGGIIYNWNDENNGLMTAKAALSKSMNTCALQTFRATTNTQKWNFSTSLGITPGNDNGVILESSSIGAFEGTNPVALAAAYSAFANGGYYEEAHSVKYVVYKESGDKQEVTYPRERVMKETTAYLITNMLLAVTPSAARVSSTDIATKTGTSSYDPDTLRRNGLSQSVVQDVWAAFYNPEVSIAFWYGFDELDKEHYTTFGASGVQRNKIESLLTKNIMKSGRFSVPKGITTAEVELETIPARLASESTPKDLKETHYFISGTEPTETSTRFSKLENVSGLNIVETGHSANLSWNALPEPDAVNIDALTNYFNTNYGEYAEKYLNLRLEYNNAKIGDFGYDIYLRSGENLVYVGRTKDNSFTINDTTGYDSVVVKSAYSIFKDNSSDGATANLTGSTTTFDIKLEAITSGGSSYINPNYFVGDTIPDVGTKTIKFLVNNLDVTDTLSSSDINYKISNCTGACTTVNSIDNTKPGEYEVEYTVNYLGQTYKEKRYIHIKSKESNPE